MRLPLGTAPAPGALTRRPRRVGEARTESPNGVPSRSSPKVAGEGASHGARGGRAPLPLNRYGLGLAPAQGVLLWSAGGPLINHNGLHVGFDFAGLLVAPRGFLFQGSKHDFIQAHVDLHLL